MRYHTVVTSSLHAKTRTTTSAGHSLAHTWCAGGCPCLLLHPGGLSRPCRTPRSYRSTGRRLTIACRTSFSKGEPPFRAAISPSCTRQSNTSVTGTSSGSSVCSAPTTPVLSPRHVPRINTAVYGTWSTLEDFLDCVNSEQLPAVLGFGIRSFLEAGVSMAWQVRHAASRNVSTHCSLQWLRADVVHACDALNTDPSCFRCGASI